MASIQINPTDEFPILVERLTELQERLNGDLTPLMQAIGVVLENNTRQRFTDKQSPDGVSWQSLAPATVKRKKNKSVSKDGVTATGILVETGDLFKSITSLATHSKVEVGTDRHYGKYHQLGGVGLPARPFLGIDDDDKDEVNNVINDYLVGVVNG